jgi:hypothetical protein
MTEEIIISFTQTQFKQVIGVFLPMLYGCFLSYIYGKGKGYREGLNEEVDEE